MTDWLPQSIQEPSFSHHSHHWGRKASYLSSSQLPLERQWVAIRSSYGQKRYKDEPAGRSRASGKDAAAWWKGQVWKSHSFTGIIPLPFIRPPLNVHVISGAGAAVLWLWGHKCEDKISTLRMAESESLLSCSGIACLRLFFSKWDNLGGFFCYLLLNTAYPTKMYFLSKSLLYMDHWCLLQGSVVNTPPLSSISIIQQDKRNCQESGEIKSGEVQVWPGRTEF